MKWSLLFAGLVLVAPLSTVSADEGRAPVEDLHDRALQELRATLQEQQKWVKVHTAEVLLALSCGDAVQETFEQEQREHGAEPGYRIGIWRVLAQAANDKAQRDLYVDKIRDVFLNAENPDRTQAAETLGKLGYTIPEECLARFRQLAADTSADGAPYRRWVVAGSGDADDVRKLAELLDDRDAMNRGKAAYALRFLNDKLPDDVRHNLAEKAEASDRNKRESDSPDRVYLLSAAYLSTRDPQATAHFKELLLPYAVSGNKDEKYEAISALASRGDQEDVPLLAKSMDDAEADVRVAAANAVLRIERRQPLPFEILDWLVLAGYAAVMIGIGVYYERRTKSTEDYLLGGRSMKPWAVGMSYFATLFSTISYLAWPGEMIQNGPMILSGVLAYPLVYLVVCRLLIPIIMRLRVTSAYEILEQRFGLSVRMLGATFFLVLRLLWMAVIIYATSRAVLVPLLRLDDTATPWVCIALGTLTVTYTSMGGLPAVIWTDVVQMSILLFGIVLSIVMISISLGGVVAWWPSNWDVRWESPKYWFDPAARVTMASAMLSVFVWYISTAGSDQIAIQRYLATRDAKSASRMFGISLISDAIVGVLLCALGLALFTYFRTHPRMLPDGVDVYGGGDRLLPQYVVKVLPAGISGLIVAGLLAAAMSSLSSGLSSSCSVVTVDWIDRFRTIKLHGMDHVRLARLVSWLVGMVVVLLSCLVSWVPGNLLEINNRLVAPLTAPLFVLFLLAMFVPWAKTFGTWMGAVASTAIAAAMAFFNVLGLSFLWIMPVSLATGIFVGCLVSLAPIGSRRPMLNIREPSLPAEN